MRTASLVLLLALGPACSETPRMGSGGGGGSRADAAAVDAAPSDAEGLDAIAADAGPTDAALDAGATADLGVDAGACTGPCAETALTVVLGGTERRLDRAQHGVGGDGRIYVEAHFGGDPACPTPDSPTPDRTLVLSGLDPMAERQTEADGVRATLFDFQGDLSTLPLVRAASVTVRRRHVEVGVAVSFELELGFADGTMQGGLHAPHCASLDG
jgi:hypothetical protein